jgi:hypothetical protein
MIFRRPLPNPRVQRLLIDRWLARWLSRSVEHISSTLLKLSLTFRDLVRMYIDLLSQFGQCAFAPTAASAAFALNAAELVRRVLSVSSGAASVERITSIFKMMSGRDHLSRLVIGTILAAGISWLQQAFSDEVRDSVHAYLAMAAADDAMKNAPSILTVSV